MKSKHHAIVLGALVCCSILATWHREKIVSVLINRSGENESGQKEKSIEKDYCNDDGSICVYHNICHDTNDDLWYTLSSDLKHFPLLNDLNLTEPNGISKQLDKCITRFTPLSRETHPDEEDILYEKETTYLVCCWISHFGHVFVQMLPSSIHAVVKAGFEKLFRSDSIKFLIDYKGKNVTTNHGNPRTPFDVFNFATHNPDNVVYLSELKDKAKSQSKTNVCFERLVAGMRYSSLVLPVLLNLKDNLAGQLEADTLNPLRDHLDKLYPSTEANVRLALSNTRTGTDNYDISTSLPPAECTLTFLRRVGHSRAIENFDEVMNATKTVFHEDKWNIQSVSFDGPTLLDQYYTVRNTMLYVTVSGTGSHLAMFLPDGAASIEIHYNNTLEDVNKGICHAMPKLTCLSSMTHCPYKNGPKSSIDYECKQNDIKVNLGSFKEAIKTARKELSGRCDVPRKK
mmetsp:Transcript_7873/g.11915  ORF Transcript_7873/g.11915 Transcript_7873/m.11915 type:complete len:457 (+) Transcript_7873:120-1490(+)